MQAAHQRAVDAAMTYLHQHAGYTRVHNPLTGTKDLQRLPGLVGDRLPARNVALRGPAPAHPRHRAQPPGPRRRRRWCRSTPSRCITKPRPPASSIRPCCATSCTPSAAWNGRAVDPFTGMAEIAGVTKDCIKAWSRRSTRLREWAHNNLVVVDGEPSAQQLAAAQKATRPAKPESKSWAELKEEWRADARGLELDRAAHLEARAARRAAPRSVLDRARLARMVAQHRQGRVHPRGPRGAGRRAAAGRRARGSARADRADRGRGRDARQRAAAKRITAKDTSCSPWTR